MLTKIVWSPSVIKIGFYMLGLGTGAATGVYITKRILESRFEDILDEEIQKTRDYYKVMFKKEEYSSPEDLRSEYNSVTEISGYSQSWEDSSNDEDDEDEEDEEDDEDDGETLVITANLKSTGPIRPMMEFPEGVLPDGFARWFEISAREFRQSEDDWTKLSWVYHAEDGVLADETNDPVDADEEIGWELRIKLESLPDGEVLHVKDILRKVLFEIVVDPSEYETIKGYITDSQLEHAMRRQLKKPRKFRSADE
jgi:hypothetical protein